MSQPTTMTEPDLTAKLVAVQEQFGEIELRVALEEQDPEQALEDLGIDTEWFVEGTFDIAVGYQSITELTASDVPPPRPTEDHLHVLIVGEAEYISDPEHISVDVYDEDERETAFLGKDLNGLDAREKAA